MAAEFGVVADIGLQLTDAEAKKAARDIQRKLEAALKPIEIKISAQQSANVNRSLGAIVTNLKNIEKQSEATGRAMERAFTGASRSKDAFRRNLTELNTDLQRTSAQAERTGTAIAKSFQGIATRAVDNLQASLNRSLNTGNVRVNVEPVVNTRTLQNLTPVSLPVIPVISRALAALQPLAVPILPIIPPVGIPEQEVVVNPVIREPLQIPINVEALVQEIQAALPRVEPPKVVIDVAGQEQLEFIQRTIRDITDDTFTLLNQLDNLNVTNLDDFTQELVEANNLLNKIEEALDIRGLSPDVINSLKSVRQELVNVIEQADVMDEELDSFDVSGLSNSIHNLEDDFTRAWNTGITGAKSFSKALGEAGSFDPLLFLRPFEKVTEGIHKALASPEGDFGKTILNSIKESFASGRDAILNPLSNILRTAQNAIEPASVGLGRDIANKVGQGLSSITRTGGVGRAFGTLFNSIGEVGGRAFLGLGNIIKNFTNNILQSASQALRQFSGLATVLLGGISAAGAVRAAADLETLKVSLAGIFPGEAEEAFEKITEFAAKTPFEIAPLTDSIIKLGASFGFTVDESIDFLRIIGDAGAAAGKSAGEIQGAVLAITQIGAAGRLTAQDLNQISSAIPTISRVKVYEELGRLLGETEGTAAKTSAEVQKLAEQGLIPSELAITAILNVAKQAPGALGAMGRQSKTLNGIISTLKDTFNLLASAGLQPVISLFEEFIDPLLNGGNALDDFRKKAEEFGTRAAAGIRAFAQEFGPQFTRIFVQAKDIFTILADTIINSLPTILAAFRATLDIVEAFATALKGILTVVGPVVTGLLQIVGALLQFKPLVILIEILVARFLLLRGISFVATLFQQLAVGAGVLIQRFTQMISGASGVSGAFNNMGTSASNFAGSINAAATIAAAAFFLIQESAANASKGAQEALNKANKAASDAIKGGQDVFAASAAREKELLKQREDAAKRIKELGGEGLTGTLDRTTRGPQGIFDQREVDKNVKIRKEAEKAIKQEVNDRALFNSFVEEVIAKTGKSRDEVLAALQKQGIGIGDIVSTAGGDFTNFLGQVDKASQAMLEGAGAADVMGTSLQGLRDIATGAAEKIKNIITGSNSLISAQEAFNDAQRASKAAADAAADAQRGIAEAQTRVKDAALATAEANQRVKDIDTDINKLKAERLRLQTNIQAQIDEEAASAQRILDIDQALRDLAEERADSERDAIIRRREFEEESAAFADRSAQAELARRAAIRDAADAQDALNELLAQGQENESINVNLSGLNLDQIRSKLANVKASLRAQQQGTQETEDEAKHKRDIEAATDRVESTQIAIRDAARAVTDENERQKDLIAENTIAERERAEQLIEFGEQEAELNRQKRVAIEEHNALLRGETGIKAQIKSLTEQITKLEQDRLKALNDVTKATLAEKEAAEGVTRAKEAAARANEDAERAKSKERLAQLELNKALAESQGREADVLNFEKLILIEKQKNLGADKAINDELERRLTLLDAEAVKKKKAELNVAAVEDILNEFKQIISFEQSFGDFRDAANALPREAEVNTLISGLSFLRQFATGNTQAFTDAFVRDIATKLVDSPDNDLLKLLKELLKKAGITIPGLKRGSFVGSDGILRAQQGIVRGFNNGRGVLAHIAEYGDEAVLPLTRKSDLQRVLSDNRVLEPVLKALQNMMGGKLKFAQGAVVDSASMAPYTPQIQTNLNSVLASLPQITLPQVAPSISLQPHTPATVPDRSLLAPSYRGASTSTLARKQQLREERDNIKQATKEGFLEALKEAELNGGDINVSLSGTGFTELDARRLAREVERQQERKKRL